MPGVSWTAVALHDRARLCTGTVSPSRVGHRAPNSTVTGACGYELGGYTLLRILFDIMTHALDCHFSVFILGKASDVVECDANSTVIESCHLEVVGPVLLALGLSMQRS